MVDIPEHKSIPSWLSSHLRNADLSNVAAAVRQVEVTTSGEVVPMIVRRSMVTGHVFPMVLLILGILYGATEVLWADRSWRGEHWMWAFLDLLVLTLVAWGVARIEWLQRLLTPISDLRLQVLRRAEAEFYKAGLHQTKDATGILIFVSLAEHQAVVLADKGISQKLPANEWDEVVKLVTHSVRDGGLAKGLTAAIARCGQLLAPHFPLKDHDRNELSDALVIKE